MQRFCALEEVVTIQSLCLVVIIFFVKIKFLFQEKLLENALN